MKYPKTLSPYLFLQPLKVATSNLLHNLGLGVACQKQLFEPKLAGVWAEEHPQNVGTTYLFLLSLKLMTSNLVHNLGSNLLNIGLVSNQNCLFTSIFKLSLDYNLPKKFRTKMGVV